MADTLDVVTELLKSCVCWSFWPAFQTVERNCFIASNRLSLSVQLNQQPFIWSSKGCDVRIHQVPVRILWHRHCPTHTHTQAWSVCAHSSENETNKHNRRLVRAWRTISWFGRFWLLTNIDLKPSEINISYWFLSLENQMEKLRRNHPQIKEQIN